MWLISRSPQGIAQIVILLALLVQPNTACNQSPKKEKKVEPQVDPDSWQHDESVQQDVKNYFWNSYRVSNMDSSKQTTDNLVPVSEPQEVVEEVVQVANVGRQLAAGPAPAAASSKCTITVMKGGADATHTSLMQQLCEYGRKNVLVKGLIEDIPANQEAQRRAEQFMVLNLHRDSFTTTPSYYYGVAPDNGNKYWKVDDTVQLTNGNSWYRMGLPMWPLVNQSMKPKKKSIIGTGGTPDWPNFAIGTPVYLIGNDVANFRDPKVSMSKFFAGELASTPQFAQSACTGTCKIIDAAKFKEGINSFILDKFTGSNNQYVADAVTVNSYSNWADLLVQESLPNMLKSFKKRQKSRCPKTQCTLCPDELLLFLNQKPCDNVSSCPFLDSIQQQLKLAECDTTEMVVGHLATPGVSAG